MLKISRELNILVVDDSSSMRRVVRQFLNRYGFVGVIEAWDGRSALEKVEQNHIDLIISDLNMPGMSGMEFLQRVKGDKKTSHIPFIMLTVEAIQKTMNKALSFDVDSYIVKPVSEQQLMDEVCRLIRDRRTA